MIHLLLTSPLKKPLKIALTVFLETATLFMVSKKSKFKDLLFLATKESYFISNNILYKQIDGVAIGSTLGPSLANAFFSHHEKNWLDSYVLEHRPSYY